MAHIKVIISFVLFVAVSLISIFVYNITSDEYKKYTPEFIVQGSGLLLSEYIVMDQTDDRDLCEDSWGQQVWLIKLKYPVPKHLLDSLVMSDNRWSFQNDARQQYSFYDNNSIIQKSIMLAVDDSIISLSYEWKK